MLDFDSPFQDHVTSPRGRDHLPEHCFSGGAGGSLCGDFVTIHLTSAGGVITDAGFEVDGCAASVAAASVVVELIRNGELLAAARIGRSEIAEALGGLGPDRIHAAVLAEEALHRALGALVAADDAGRLVADDPRRVLVAMSGGVDSAVAALLSGEGREHNLAVTLQLWDDPATDGTASCCSPQAVTAARQLAQSLGMAHFTVDLRDAFRRGVVDPYIAAFDEALTPNPCVGCNGHVRFDALDAVRARLGAARLATGHYARIEHDSEGPLLAAAIDDNKDQTYMLSALRPELLARLEFPLGELTKPEVREYAARVRLSVAKKPESQDLCFLAGTNRDDFLARHGNRNSEPGAIIDTDGNEIGRHAGSHRFTIGQRRGIGVAGPEPFYVLAVDKRTHAVTVGTHDQLATSSVRAIGARLLRPSAVVDRVKLRYRNAPTACRIPDDHPCGHHRELRIELDEPVFGAAPGQIACLMHGERVVGWATIARPLPEPKSGTDSRDGSALDLAVDGQFANDFAADPATAAEPVKLLA